MKQLRVPVLTMVCVLSWAGVVPSGAQAGSGPTCESVGAWIDSAPDDGRIPVRLAAMAWTGSEALIWGGEIGYRYDP